MTTATHTARASCARLKNVLIGGSRIAYATAAPISAPARKSPPLANSSPKTNGRAASENEWALRRNCRWTTHVSAMAQATAITHHGRCGLSRGGSPLTDVRNSAAASAARARPYTDTATAGDTRRRARIAWSGEVVNEGSPSAALVGGAH